MSGIEYTIKRSARARRISIGVHHTGNVIVTIPLRMPEERVKYFVEEKADWILAAQAKMEKRFARTVTLTHSRREYKALKEYARTKIEERLAFFNTFYKFRFKDVRIRMQSSRWGSCSAHGNLNFNYSLIKLPEHLLDYVVVHELCHLKEMNHSARFWALVGQTLPDYKERRKELRRWVHID